MEHASTMPQVPDPETLPTLTERMRPYAHEMDGWHTRPRAIDVRYVDDPPRVAKDSGHRQPAPRCGCAPTARCRTTRWCTSARWPSPAT
jgi:hypothetical protein